MTQAKLNSAVVKINRFVSTVGFTHLINGWWKDEIATFEETFLETFKIAKMFLWILLHGCSLWLHFNP